MSEAQDTFGPDLRRARMRSGVSLDAIAAKTKVGVDLWDAMERNDFSRWPGGIYARAFIREYAEMIGVDPAETVNEFCRWFPLGNRRAEPLIRGQAEIIGHSLTWCDDLTRVEHDRRAPSGVFSDPLRSIQARQVRLVAAALDFALTLLLATIAAILLGSSLWPALGVMAAVYHGISLVITGSTPAAWLVDSYASAHPQFWRNGELFGFRRLGPPKSDPSLQRGTAS